MNNEWYAPSERMQLFEITALKHRQRQEPNAIVLQAFGKRGHIYAYNADTIGVVVLGRYKKAIQQVNALALDPKTCLRYVAGDEASFLVPAQYAPNLARILRISAFAGHQVYWAY